jgi:hypothetical protein
MLDKQGYMHSRPWTRQRIRTRTRARAWTHTHKYVIRIAFPRQQWFANAPQCYIIRTLPCYVWSSWELPRSTEAKQVYLCMYKVVQIWPGQTLTCLHTNRPGSYFNHLVFKLDRFCAHVRQCTQGISYKMVVRIWSCFCLCVRDKGDCTRI